jgi:hypothetical protein
VLRALLIWLRLLRPISITLSLSMLPKVRRGTPSGARIFLGGWKQNGLSAKYSHTSVFDSEFVESV